MPLPDPMSCLGHLNESERAAHEADRLRREAISLPYELARFQLLASDPACWSWPVPTQADLEGLRGSYSGEARRLFDADDAWGYLLMVAWHAGRCAICGAKDVLVTDHDHKTGFVRGLLCRSDNTLEGVGYDGVFRKYREFSPAVICGVRERYWNPFTREFAEPAPPPHDPWKDNPMKNIGL